MPSSLPRVARQRIVGPARASIASRAAPTGDGRIPVTPDQWTTCVSDAGLVELLSDSREHLERVSTAWRGADATQTREQAEDLARHFAAKAASLEAISWLAPSHALEPAELHQTLKQAYLGVLDAAWDDGGVAVDGLLSELEWPDRVAAAAALTAPDVWETALGVPWEALRTPEGRYSAARLLARFHGNYEELNAVLNGLTAWLGPAGLALTKGTGLVAYLLNSPRPYLTILVSIDVYSQILASFEQHPLSTAQALRELALRTDRSYSSQRGVMRAQHALHEADSEAERAFLQLDLYRRAAEGQLRPLVWTLLKVKNGLGAGRVPELGKLRAKLVADGGTLASIAASMLNVVARNGAAHEDYFWDRGRGVLVVGDDEILVDHLQMDFSKIYGFVCGAELAWAKARATSASLRALQDVGQISEPDVLRLERTIALFGTNGITVAASRLEGARFEVVAENLAEEQVNPAIQALMLVCAEFAELRELHLYVPSAEEPVLALTRRTLDHCLRLWLDARPVEDAMPFSTFLPAHVENRTRVENAHDTMTAVLWFALGEAVDWVQEAADAIAIGHPGVVPDTVSRLRKRLARIARSLEMCLDLLAGRTTHHITTTREVVALLRAAVLWLGIEVRSGRRGLSGQIFDELGTRLDSLPQVEPFPNLPPPDHVRPGDG